MSRSINGRVNGHKFQKLFDVNVYGIIYEIYSCENTSRYKNRLGIRLAFEYHPERLKHVFTEEFPADTPIWKLKGSARYHIMLYYSTF